MMIYFTLKILCFMVFFMNTKHYIHDFVFFSLKNPSPQIV